MIFQLDLSQREWIFYLEVPNELIYLKFTLPLHKISLKSFTGVCAIQLQMLLFQNALCCSLYERNCVCAVTKIFTKFLPANNFCKLLRVTCKRSCTSAGNAQAQLHFRDDQQRAFGISNISNWSSPNLFQVVRMNLDSCNDFFKNLWIFLFLICVYHIYFYEN